jgi:SPP1 family predicted phage head-tail adaptor
MGKHLKDRKVTIYKSESTIDDHGYVEEKWRPLSRAGLWAYSRQLSAKEFFAAAAHQHQEERLFVINWRADILPGMTIHYKGKWYDIVRVDPFEDYKEDLKLSAKESNRGIASDRILPFE